MIDLQAIADRLEIEALRAEFVDAGLARDYDRFALLFTHDATWRIPGIDVNFSGREEIRIGVEGLQGLWEHFVQNVFSGIVRLEGATAVGRALTSEFGRLKNGRSQLNYSVYHDRYKRTSDGWKFAQRIYEVIYIDTSPLAGSMPAKPTNVAPQLRRGLP